MNTFTNSRISEDGLVMAADDQYGMVHVWHRASEEEDWEYDSAYDALPDWFNSQEEFPG